jgi:hypothetical protein
MRVVNKSAPFSRGFFWQGIQIGVPFELEMEMSKKIPENQGQSRFLLSWGIRQKF